MLNEVRGLQVEQRERVAVVDGTSVRIVKIHVDTVSDAIADAIQRAECSARCFIRTPKESHDLTFLCVVELLLCVSAFDIVERASLGRFQSPSQKISVPLSISVPLACLCRSERDGDCPMRNVTLSLRPVGCAN